MERSSFYLQIESAHREWVSNTKNPIGKLGTLRLWILRSSEYWDQVNIKIKWILRSSEYWDQVNIEIKQSGLWESNIKVTSSGVIMRVEERIQLIWNNNESRRENTRSGVIMRVEERVQEQTFNSLTCRISSP